MNIVAVFFLWAMDGGGRGASFLCTNQNQSQDKDAKWKWIPSQLRN